MKEVQGASNVENTSLKSARAILSKVVGEGADYQDHTFFMMQLKQYLQKLPTNVSNPRTVHKRLSGERLFLSKTLRMRGVESQQR